MKPNKGKGNMVKSKTPGLKADIPGVQVLRQAKQKGSGFKAGGVPAAEAPAKKDGGSAEGAAPAARADRAPRSAPKMASGGSMRGRSPFSHAASPADAVSGGKRGGY